MPYIARVKRRPGTPSLADLPKSESAGIPATQASQQSRAGTTSAELSRLSREKMSELKRTAGELPVTTADELAPAAGIGHRAQPQEDGTDRLTEIRKRIAAGFYNHREIKQKIADRLADNLNNDSPESEGTHGHDRN